MDYPSFISNLIAWSSAACALTALIITKSASRAARAVVVISDVKTNGIELDVIIENVGGRGALDVLLTDVGGGGSTGTNGLSAGASRLLKLPDRGAATIELRVVHRDVDGGRRSARSQSMSRTSSGTILLPPPSI